MKSLVSIKSLALASLVVSCAPNAQAFPFNPLSEEFRSTLTKHCSVRYAAAMALALSVLRYNFKKSTNAPSRFNWDKLDKEYDGKALYEKLYVFLTYMLTPENLWYFIDDEIIGSASSKSKLKAAKDGSVEWSEEKKSKGLFGKLHDTNKPVLKACGTAAAIGAFLRQLSAGHKFVGELSNSIGDVDAMVATFKALPEPTTK